MSNFTMPADVFEQLQQLTLSGYGSNETESLRKAVAAAAWARQEEEAILEGVADYEAGRVQDFAEFMQEFRREHGLPERP